jgi:hypothetical protein
MSHERQMMKDTKYLMLERHFAFVALALRLQQEEEINS